MFPLPGVFLFPHHVLPLHVFEPRYRQLVGDLLDTAGRFVVATQLDPESPADSPAVLPVAGLGEIAHHERLPDGRYHLLVAGLARVTIHEVPSERLYRRVACAPFAEIPIPADDAPDLRRRLLGALVAKLHKPLPLPEDAPPALLADLLAQTLPPTAGFHERFFAEPSVARRAAMVLAAADA